MCTKTCKNKICQNHRCLQGCDKCKGDEKGIIRKMIEKTKEAKKNLKDALIEIRKDKYARQ